MYTKKSPSTKTKATISTISLIILLYAFNILTTTPLTPRKLTSIIFSTIVYCRYAYSMYFIIKRTINWDEAFGIIFAFGCYYLIYAYFMTYAGDGFDLIDILAVFIFLAGNYLSTMSEIERDVWKKRDENNGKLYTEGWFKYSMHINFFGEMMWISSYAILSHGVYVWLVPLVVGCFFVFFNIPELDRYLAERYGEQFEAYREKTAVFVPFVY